MKRILALAIVLVSIAFVPVYAEELPPEEDPDCWYDAKAMRYVCGGSSTPTTPARPRGPRVTTTTLGYDLLWVPELALGPDGICIQSAYRDLGRQPSESEQLHSEMQFFRFMRAGYSMCPDAELPTGTTPALEAAQFLEEIRLPKPEPYIQPGKLPVGFDAFLETGAPTTRTFGPKATPFGDLTLTARAEIYVDWDDPLDEVDGEHGPYTGDPGPYPEGEITHLYQYDGFYEITVRYEWVAEWRIGNAHSGTIPGANTSGTYPAPGFEVYSRQAVG